MLYATSIGIEAFAEVRRQICQLNEQVQALSRQLSNSKRALNPLTTLQRAEIGYTLTAENAGFPVFDTDTQILYIWDGVVWIPYIGNPSLSSQMSIYNELISTPFDGVLDVFTLTYPFVENSTKVYLNGQRIRLGLTADYIELLPNQIQLNYPPVSTDVLSVDYDKVP